MFTFIATLLIFCEVGVWWDWSLYQSRFRGKMEKFNGFEDFHLE